MPPLDTPGPVRIAQFKSFRMDVDAGMKRERKRGEKTRTKKKGGGVERAK